MGSWRSPLQEITLPEMTCAKATNEEKALILSTLKLDDFMRNSCYYLEPDAPKKSTATQLVITDMLIFLLLHSMLYCFASRFYTSM